MKELELTCILRNNRLKERRSKLGLSQEALAREIGITQSEYSAYEAMRYKPTSRRYPYVWKVGALKIAEYFHVKPEELFPSKIQEINTPRVVRRVDVMEVRALISSDQARRMLPVGSAVEEREMRECVRGALEKLPERERMILEKRFGVSGEECSYRELGNHIDRTGTTIKNIEKSGLKNLKSILRKQKKISDLKEAIA